jgi:Predicted N-acetylglucosamine kinase
MSHFKKIIICVDAGGTSCKVAIYSLEGVVLSKGIGKSGSPAVTKDWYLHINRAIQDALSKITEIEYQILGIQIGVSGISALHSYDDVREYFINIYQSPCYITSDTMSALYSVLHENEEEGIVVISGTGVGVFGQNKGGKTWLIGGWGHLIREYGSAYSIVHRFCVHLINHFESMEELSILEKLFLQRCNFKNIRDLNHLFYQNDKDKIANLSIFFKEEANKGNKEAIHLLKEQGMFLGKQVKQVMKFLNLPNQTKIGFRGGFLEKDGKYILQGIHEYFEQNGIVLTFEEKSMDQLYGVYRLALNNIRSVI